MPTLDQDISVPPGFFDTAMGGSQEGDGAMIVFVPCVDPMNLEADYRYVTKGGCLLVSTDHSHALTLFAYAHPPVLSGDVRVAFSKNLSDAKSLARDLDLWFVSVVDPDTNKETNYSV